MEFLSQLWMPIVASAVIIWIASFILHMVLPHHKSEFKALPDEGKVLGALEGVGAGQYMFPWGTMADWKTPEFQEKMKRGPSGSVSIWSGPVNMGQNLALTFIYYVVVGAFVAFVAWTALSNYPPDYMHVFKVAGGAAFLAHGLGFIPHMIWYKNKGFWAYLFDGVVFAGLTAGTFGWLWPKASAA